MLKLGTILLSLMLLSACASSPYKQPDYIVNTIVPRAQPEDKSIAFPVCKNEITGDLLECERLWRQAYCLLVAQYDLFMRRATQDKHSVSVPVVCTEPFRPDTSG